MDTFLKGKRMDTFSRQSSQVTATNFVNFCLILLDVYTCMCVSAPHVFWSHWKPEEVSALELELQIVVNFHVGGRNQTWSQEQPGLLIGETSLCFPFLSYILIPLLLELDFLSLCSARHFLVLWLIRGRV